MLRRPSLAAHLVVVTCALALALSYRWTWRLWLHRTDGVPNLPAVNALRTFSLAPLLIIACALMIVVPRIGSLIHALILLVAILGDQVRIQPEFLSLSLLALTAAWGSERLSRAHLGTLWFWAGCNKALSLGWASGGAGFIAGSLHQGSHRGVVAWGVPVAEMAIGLSTMIPRLRIMSGVGGAALHVGIFVTLSPLFASFNSGVWPWNVAFAVAAPLVFLTGPFHPSHTPARPLRHRWGTATAVGAMVVIPAGFYLGVSDAYLSHNLYSSNTAVAQRCQANACAPFQPDGFVDLNVPVPPEVRLFRSWFRSTCSPGETFTMVRPANRLVGARQSTETCP